MTYDLLKSIDLKLIEEYLKGTENWYLIIKNLLVNDEKNYHRYTSNIWFEKLIKYLFSLPPSNHLDIKLLLIIKLFCHWEFYKLIYGKHNYLFDTQTSAMFSKIRPSSNLLSGFPMLDLLIALHKLYLYNNYGKTQILFQT